MKLWKIEQSVNGDYDTFDSAVVAAETEQAARETHPRANRVLIEGRFWFVNRHGNHHDDDTWAPVADVKATYIGEAAPGTEAGVIVASFNAG